MKWFKCEGALNGLDEAKSQMQVLRGNNEDLLMEERRIYFDLL